MYLCYNPMHFRQVYAYCWRRRRQWSANMDHDTLFYSDHCAFVIDNSLEVKIHLMSHEHKHAVRLLFRRGNEVKRAAHLIPIFPEALFSYLNRASKADLNVSLYLSSLSNMHRENVFGIVLSLIDASDILQRTAQIQRRHYKIKPKDISTDTSTVPATDLCEPKRNGHQLQ